MAAGGLVKTQHDCTCTVRDGAALSQAFGMFTESVSISNIVRKRRTVEHIETRGKLVGVRSKGLVLATCTLTFHGANFSGTVSTAGASEVNPQDVFNRAGTWSSATSTLPVNLGGSDVYCVDIDIGLEGTDGGDASDHVLTLKAVHGVVQFNIADPFQVVVECTVYGDIDGDVSIVMPTLA